MNKINSPESASEQPRRVRLRDIAVSHLKISLSSFGGGLSAWVQLEIVEKRKWLSDEEFLSAFALCRILPGPNAVNLAVYTGSRLRGGAGVLAALAGLTVAPFFVVLLLGIAYFKFQNITVVQSALRGMAAVAVGMTLGMGVKMSFRYPFSLWSIAIMAVSFLTIGVFRWPLLYVGAVLIPLSVGLAWRSAAKPPGRAGAAGGAEEKEKPASTLPEGMASEAGKAKNIEKVDTADTADAVKTADAKDTKRT